jgi:hypothetical protein
MATDEVVKKVRILRKDLPNATIDGTYVVRYRVVSDDLLKTSQWSSFHTITAKTVEELLGVGYSVTHTVISDGTGMRISWDIPEGLGADTFDVYIAWGTSTPVTDTVTYFTTVSGNSVYATIPAGMQYVKALVQLPTYPKQLFAAFKVFESDSVSTEQLGFDGGTI